MGKILIAGVALVILNTPAFAVMGFLKGERTSGMNKMCFYDVLGSTYTLNVGAAQLCPVTIDAPNPAPNPAQNYQQPNSGGKMGFLKGERTSGMNKTCFYDALGSTYTLTTSAVSLCPLNHNF
jgi:hypothetical protein